MSHCDALSRIPLSDVPQNVPTTPDTVFLVEKLNTSPTSADQIKVWTEKDPVLSRVKRFILHGWPDNTEPEFQPYRVRKLELSVDSGCVLWGSRVVVPPPGRIPVIEMLHESHPGIVRMKSIARSYVWWPKMDDDLERKVRNCENCQVNRKLPASAPLHPWEYPQRVWSRLHVDFAGPFMGKMILVIVDAYSKWIDAHVMTTSTAEATVSRLRTTFATFGLPESVVSDNGPNFTSKHFKQFLERNGVQHTTVAPYHPSSNGLAERAVQTLKDGLRKMEYGDLQSKVSRVLFKYRITPQSTTGKAPCELMFGRKLRSHLDLLHPDEFNSVLSKQAKQKEWHDKSAVNRSFNEGDLVYVVNFGTGQRWIPGVVIEKSGPVSYVVKLSDDKNVRRHIDHVRLRYAENVSQNTSVTSDTFDDLPADLPDSYLEMSNLPAQEPNSTSAEQQSSSRAPAVVEPTQLSSSRAPSVGEQPSSVVSTPSVPDTGQQTPVEPRRSGRIRTQTDFYKA